MTFWKPFDVTDNDSKIIGLKSEAERAKISNKDIFGLERIILNIYDCLEKAFISASENEILKRVCQLTKLSWINVFTFIKTRGVTKYRKTEIETTKELIRRRLPVI